MPQNNPRRKGGRYARQKPRSRKPLFLTLGAAAAAIALIFLCLRLTSAPAAPTEPGTIPLPTRAETEATVPTVPTTQPESPIATATLGAMGDLLMHKPIINTAKQEDGSYDFSYIFEHLKPYIEPLDYAAANLETTFGGPGNPYQGNPLFNCPDDFAQDVKELGFDMLLTANNHCADTWAEGIIRTVQTVRAADLEVLGTRESKDEPAYSILDVNGIQLGMLSYTYATGVTADGRPQFNYNAYVSQGGLVNFFTESNLSKFYDEVQTHLDNMKAEGAEATILYIHWGTEYELAETATQKAIAQKLCDMGVDVIIGGHPHVVEPMDLLESTLDPGHKTVVIYSMGNAVSNQRRQLMRLNTGHTEDGALFTLTFEKYADGTVRVADVGVLPTWVKITGTVDAPTGYYVLPLDLGREETWQETFDLDDAALSELRNSYNRTMDIVGPGLRKCQDYFAQAKTTPS